MYFSVHPLLHYQSSRLEGGANTIAAFSPLAIICS